MYLELKRQLEEEAKEREKQEKGGQDGMTVPTINGLMGQANSMLSQQMSKVNIPKIGSFNIPH